MAKPDKSPDGKPDSSAADTSVPAPAGAVAPATTVAEATAADERFKMIRDPDSGQMVKRKDFVLRRWTKDKKSRGDIAKELTKIVGKKIPYQIVFQYTHKIPGGPDKPPAEAGSASPPADGGAQGQPAS